MDGLRIPIFDDRHKLVILNHRGVSGVPMAYKGQVLVDDPDELHAYARFLWWQWQAQHGQFGETPAELYTRQMFREAAAWLLDMYDEADAAAPPELLRACRAILGAEIKASANKEKGSNLRTGAPLSQQRTEKAFEAAARFEATRAVERPSVTEVARHLVEAGLVTSPDHIRQKHAESNVIRWRKEQRYRHLVELYRREYAAPAAASPRAVKKT